MQQYAHSFGAEIWMLFPIPLNSVTNPAHCSFVIEGWRSRQVLETEHDYFQPLLVLGTIYELQRRPQDAITTLERAREQNRGKGGVYYNALETLGHAYAVTGRRADAERIIAEFSGFPEDKGDVSYYQALIHAGLGDTDKAFALLESSSSEWTLPPVTLFLDPRYDKLRADPRYGALMKRKFGQLAPVS
jgi:tetratricopeptide (TPR) repeat protein